MLLLKIAYLSIFVFMGIVIFSGKIEWWMIIGFGFVVYKELRFWLGSEKYKNKQAKRWINGPFHRG